jgi:hypothetical protein
MSQNTQSYTEDEKTYDRIYAEAWFSMRNLRDYITVKEPQKLTEIEKIMDKLQEIDHYMAYGGDGF